MYIINYSQKLDIDASMLLDAVGAEVPASSSDGSELLVRLLQAKSHCDPIDLSDLPDLEIDEWTNEAP